MYIVSEFTVSRSTVWGDLGVYTLGISIARACTLEVYTLGAPPAPQTIDPHILTWAYIARVSAVCTLGVYALVVYTLEFSIKIHPKNY